MPSLPWSAQVVEASKLVDSPVAKLVFGVVQTLLCAAAIGSFQAVNGSLETIKSQLNTYQTSLALVTQRVESLERTRDARTPLLETLMRDNQKYGYQIEQIQDAIKQGVLNGRPR